MLLGPPTMSEAAPRKLADVEVLRAMAILFTLIAHYRFSYPEDPSWVVTLDQHAHFWGGVDLFFVISGFVICKNLIPQFLAIPSNDRLAGARLLVRFWKRRIFRLWPSSWLWAALSVVVIVAWYPAHLRNTVNDVMSALLQVYNFHAYACSNGATTCSHLVVGVYWSLSLEEQFYIVLPALFFVFKARTLWVIGALFIAGILMSAVWPAPLAFFRWEGFCLGVLLAWLYVSPGQFEQVERELVRPLGRMTVVVTILMLVALPLIANGALTNKPYPLAAACSGVLVFLAAFDRNYLGVPRLLRRGLVYLGGRSYSIYLIHVPVFVGFRVFAPRFFASAGGGGLAHGLWLAVVTAIVVALSELNFRFVESRFRHASETTSP